MIKINSARIVISCLAVVSLAACARLDGPTNSGPFFTQSQTPAVNQTPAAQSPVVVASLPAAQTTSASVTAVDSQLSEFVDSGVINSLSVKDKNEAASAQYFALQTGRPGAPRNWSGDTGATGSIVVGPFVRVNNLDCREFTHTVKLNGSEFVKTGTSCRENGTWIVA